MYRGLHRNAGEISRISLFGAAFEIKCSGKSDYGGNYAAVTHL
jgi:hypothetical protein